MIDFLLVCRDGDGNRAYIDKLTNLYESDQFANLFVHAHRGGGEREK